MSGGMEDSRHEEAASREIESAASKLAEALIEVRDAAFGLPSGALDIANNELRRAGVKIVLSKK